LEGGVKRRAPNCRKGAASRDSAKRETVSSAEAIRELGFARAPAREALRKAVEWYWENGYAATPAG